MTVDQFLDFYDDIVFQLTEFHEIFYKLATVGKPVITDSIPTAAVGFDKEGRHILYMFNPDFVESLSPYEIKFVMCHEMLHVLYNHGKRFKDAEKGKEFCNIAADIVINHQLLKSFDFNRFLLPTLNKLGVDDTKKDKKNKKEKDKGGICFIDTVFPKEKQKTVKKDETYEYYFNKLIEDVEFQEIEGFIGIGNGGSLDDHSQLPGLTEEEMKEMLEEALGEDKAEKLMEEMSKGRSETGDAFDMFNSIYKFIRKKGKFEDIMRGYQKKLRAIEVRDKEMWSMKSRRMSLMHSDFLLPSMMEVEDEDGYKFDLWLFQDISGSCYEMTGRFLDLARSIPTDIFHIKFHVFNTGVERVGLWDKNIPRGGGTSFTPIETYIQDRVKAGEKYPDAVFVITDGDGNPVRPQYPKKWNWFLSQNYTRCIPEESRIFTIDDFE